MGVNEERKRLEKYVSIIPNSRQKIVQEMKFYAFIHFTVNTFTGKEWGNGKEDPKIFNPKQLDTDQWCKAMKDAKMKGAILTCKHHDGFCLWPTKTTEHCIRNSTYKDGKGDIVKELAESCRKYGLKFGIYLSPWDRNSEFYSTDKYMDFYIAQLTELLSNYGDVFMLWLDGACESKRDGKPCQVYDFPRIYETALKLQPHIAMSGCAPDIRWVGNESGVSRKSEWNVVPLFNYGEQNVSDEASESGEQKEKKRCVDVLMRDLGSRKFLSQYEDFMWYPAEVDVSIRPGWFYHPFEDFLVRSINNLMKIYYLSVGGNSLLLLNIPPNKKGLFSKKDVNRLKLMGEYIGRDEELIINNVSYESDIIGKENFEIENLKLDKTYSPKSEKETYNLYAKFEKTSVDRITLREDTDYSQRVEEFRIFAGLESGDILIYEGTVIGFNKIAIFKPIETNSIRVEIISSRFEPYINYFKVHKTGGYRFR